MGKNFRLHDCLCSPTLIGEFDTLGEMKEYAREYNEMCEGYWFPLFEKLEYGRYVTRDYKF